MIGYLLGLSYYRVDDVSIWFFGWCLLWVTAGARREGKEMFLFYLEYTPVLLVAAKVDLLLLDRLLEEP